MQGYYVERTYICGNYIEKERFYCQSNLVASITRPREPKDKTKQTTKEIEEKNRKKAEKKLRRLANTNFIHGHDLFVTISAKSYKDLAEFSRITRKFLDRLKYHFKTNKLGDFKYIYCFGEHKELNKENKVGVHSHLVISGMSWDKLIEIWEKDKDAGQIHISKLRFDNNGGIGGLMAYFMRNVKELKERHRERGEGHKVENMRAYNPSLNLKKPKVSKLKYITRKQMQEQPKARKGFVITDVENTPTSYGIYQVIHIMKISKMRI